MEKNIKKLQNSIIGIKKAILKINPTVADTLIATCDRFDQNVIDNRDDLDDEMLFGLLVDELSLITTMLETQVLLKSVSDTISETDKILSK